MTAEVHNIQRSRRILMLVAVLPVIAVLVFGLIDPTDLPFFPPRRAAALDNVVVTGTVGAAMTVSDGCGSVLNFTILQGTESYSTPCTITFGSTNDAAQKLTIEDSNASPFLGAIANTTANCATGTDSLPLGSDNAGVHITGNANGAAIHANWVSTACGTAATAGNNSKFRAVPANGSPQDACSAAAQA